MTTRELRLVVCEGMDDIYFLDGAFVHQLGATAAPGEQGIRQIDQKSHAFRSGASSSGALIQVFESHGKADLARVARLLLTAARVEPRFTLTRVLVVADADCPAGGPLASAAQSLSNQVEGTAPASGSVAPTFRWISCDIDGVAMAPMLWFSGSPSGTPGVPEKQTLERIVTAAMASAHPARVAPVQAFAMASPHGPPGHEHQAIEKAYNAKGSPEIDGAARFQLMWKDAAVAEALRDALQATGQWSLLKWIAE